MRSFHRPSYKPRKYYITNYRIEAPTLRVIDDKGAQIGVISKQEALRLAQEKYVDLVLIAQHAKPPVAKLIDFKKFLYQEEKKEKEAKKGIKKSGSKDISLSLFIGVADLERLENKGKEFLKEGYQVRVNMLLKGREVMKKPMAFDLMNKYIGSLGEVNVSKPPRLEGRVIRAVVAKRK
ncbi:MAG: Translation initiation factor IF-3 [Candidatus Roizmanbacteria bacterium GW2011_GWA2_35_19]|uniref:Translation initiation factor IF-3 n=2 Tax=Candidatus Roizmaniibacteriota TaxID=1752723 RepID=A0A0G0EYV2_9BACT|nr:MAG: Translation initiation factor IF-3 [Candidatus Roizmanbacteria bacterium GW2011_GWC2_35_12]KKP72357.1 MAG: Translation initiation factor IF-3 [Candidatus Roizmanbacteria bacterium GW2011_GWA2_35_19]